MNCKLGLIRGLGLAIAVMVLTPAVADAATRFAINPPQPTATSTITVTFKVPHKLPKGQRWMLAMTDGLTPPQSCATFDLKTFSTRGRKGQILRATFRPQQDILDTNPTAWCTGSPDASNWVAVAISAARSGKRVHVVAHSRFFTIM